MAHIIRSAQCLKRQEQRTGGCISRKPRTGCCIRSTEIRMQGYNRYADTNLPYCADFSMVTGLSAILMRLFVSIMLISVQTVTPLIKVNRTKSYGAEVILYGDVYDDSCAYAEKLAQERGSTFVHPFDDLDIVAGQGSIAMEIVQELPTVDYILAPVGGGGLITGVSTLAKMLNPKIKVIGVEPAAAPSMTMALASGEPVTLDSANTIADGTAVKRVGDRIFEYAKKNIDQMLTVEDDELVGAFLDMVENHKMIDHNVFHCTAWTDSERPYLFGICITSG